MNTEIFKGIEEELKEFLKENLRIEVASESHHWRGQDGEYQRTTYVKLVLCGEVISLDTI